jgi:hypothetical protein
MNWDLLPQYVTAAAGIGTAAFALVDGSKILRSGGVSSLGFGRIAAALARFFAISTPPAHPASGAPALGYEQILSTLQANWLNGTQLADQKAIAKSLLKLALTDGFAERFASATGTPQTTVDKIVRHLTEGIPLVDADISAMGRFDLVLSAIIDEAYERADQIYRNSAKAWSVLVSVVLGVVGFKMAGLEWVDGLLVGLAATPIAPVAKDLTSALAAATKAAEVFRR